MQKKCRIAQIPLGILEKASREVFAKEDSAQLVILLLLLVPAESSLNKIEEINFKLKNNPYDRSSDKFNKNVPRLKNRVVQHIVYCGINPDKSHSNISQSNTLISTALMLGRDKLSVRMVQKYQAINQEITSENEDNTGNLT